MITWIIGLSGSGKSTLAKEVVKEIRQKKSNIILIDGDEFREIFDNDLGYSIEDRKKNAMRIAGFCKFCEEQNINVVCAILSIFSETREWNRKNFSNYFEVFIDTPISELKKRDSKKLYENFEQNKVSNVVGLDIKFEKPTDADLIIKNDKSRELLLSFAKIISDKTILDK